MKEAYKKDRIAILSKSRKLMIADLNNVSILFYPAALCKLGPQKQFSKKRKMNDF